ncbi:hypothetical protein A3D14_02810 [Candidatus Saccharibacteria bacterium RIFCSPHIGHO2_02_FULL_47_12]|nr:MAG: hypothetical protein A3D14_02810 [Candidatus Saccharibacteria bacterium RIFCSPHIGHO2_02_FULL_47_12]
MSVEHPSNVVYLRPVPEPVPELPVEQADPEFWGKSWGARLRSIGSKALLCASFFYTGATVAAMEIGASSNAAGHDIRTTATADGYLHARTGLSGSLHIPMENFKGDSHGLGANVQIGETENIDESDAETYGSFLANIDPDVDEARLAMLKFAGLAGLASVGLVLAVSKSKLINPKYKDWCVDMLGSENLMRLALAGAVTLPGVALPIKQALLDEKPEANVSPVFDGTVLEGARATGWMKVLVNKFGVGVLDRIDSINNFSDETIKNLREAFRLAPQPFQAEGTVTVLGFEGLKCNPAVMPALGETIKLVDADFAVSAGDDVLGQESIDGLCLDKLVSQTKGIDLVMSIGNHRTVQTASQAEELGITVLKEGEVVQKAGLLIAGAPDAYGYGVFEEEQDEPGFPARVELGAKLAKVACAQDKLVSIVALNQPRAANVVMLSGCASTVMTGGIDHSYESHQKDGVETTYVQEKSAGGATYEEGSLNAETLEPPNVPIDLYRYEFDKETGKLLYFQVITINPNTTANISAPTLTTFAISPDGRKILFGK